VLSFGNKPVTIVGFICLRYEIVDDEQTIIDQLQTIVTEKTELKLGRLEPSLDLEASGLDSVARINLVMEIEEHFGFELTDSESANISSIGDLITQIQAKTSAA